MVDEQKRGMKAAIKAAIGRDSYAEYMDVSATRPACSRPPHARKLTAAVAGLQLEGGGADGPEARAAVRRRQSRVHAAV